jgi:hypothetical protein
MNKIEELKKVVIINQLMGGRTKQGDIVIKFLTG